jgi:hypothetical protein
MFTIITQKHIPSAVKDTYSFSFKHLRHNRWILERNTIYYIRCPVRAIAAYFYIKTAIMWLLRSLNVKARYYDDSNAEQRWCKHKTTMMKTRNNEGTMLKTRYNIVFRHRSFSISTFHYHYFHLFSSLFRVFTIVISCFHHRSIVFSSRLSRVFIIVDSCFHYCFFAFLYDMR